MADFTANNIYHPDNSFYTSDGTLTEDRTIDADFNSLSIINAGNISIDSFPSSTSYQTIVSNGGILSIRDDSPQGYSATTISGLRNYFSPKPLRLNYGRALYNYGGYNSGLYTVPTDGIYNIAASCTLRVASASTTVSSELSVCVNNSVICSDQRTEEYLTATGGFIQFVSRITTSMSLTAGDEVEVLYSSSFSGQFLREGLFHIVRIGPN